MNFADYLNHQKGEDRRSFIIHYPACSGKSQFARKLQSVRTDIYYLDLLAYFLATPSLPAVSEFDFKALRSLLLSLVVPQAVVLVDNSDFLLNTWNAAEKQALLNWVRVGLRSPADTEKIFVFIIQDDNVLATADFRNTHGEPRVLALNMFDAV